MQALVRTGGKQYRVQEGDVIKVEKLPGDVGNEVVFDEVLMLKGAGEENEVLIGEPALSGVQVKGEIVEQGKGRKVVVFRFKRRKGYNKKAGHRQRYTAVRVKEITGAA